MFTPTCFRSIVHHSFRSSLQVASISTSAVLRNNNGQDYGHLVNVLEEEGKRQLEEEDGDDEPKAFARILSDVGQNSSSYGTYKEKIRGFLPNRPFHPTEFSRARRVVAPRRLPKRWDLGLPTRKARYNDIFYQLGIDPVDECMNGTLLSHFMTRMGRVQRRADTELTMRSQRRVAKAIKRAKMMGILSTHSKSGLYRLSS